MGREVKIDEAAAQETLTESVAVVIELAEANLEVAARADTVRWARWVQREAVVEWLRDNATHVENAVRGAARRSATEAQAESGVPGVRDA